MSPGTLMILKARVSCQDGKSLMRVENGRYVFQIITFQDLKNAAVIAITLVFPSVGKDRKLHCEFRGYIQVRSRCDPQVRSAPLRSLRQETECFRLPLTPPSSYVGELPNSHGRTSADKSYVLHGMPY